MRISVLSSTVVLGTLAAAAHADHKEPRVAAASGPAREERSAPTTGELAFTGPARAPYQEPFLAVGDITALVRPHAPEIQHCYLRGIGAGRRPGHLDVTFVIARDGNVLSVKAAAPGVPARTVRRIGTCIRKAVDGLQFPSRPNDTTAIVPYFFQRTVAPNAGPQMSCWNRKGC